LLKSNLRRAFSFKMIRLVRVRLVFEVLGTGFRIIAGSARWQNCAYPL